jgi:hypothetical protein
MQWQQKSRARLPLRTTFFACPGAPRPSALHPKIDRPPRENPRGTTFRAIEVEHYEATMSSDQQIREGGE